MHKTKETLRRRRRWELAAVGAFVLINLAVPLFIEDFFPFTTTPMFRDRPRYYSVYNIYELRGDTVSRLDNEELAAMLASLSLHRTYDGNPHGLGVGQNPPPTLDRFTDTLAEQPGEREVRQHVMERLGRLKDVAGVEVEQQIVGPLADGKVGVVSTNRWRVMQSEPSP